MAKIDLGDITAELPDTWQSQGMLTFTLPSADKNVRPNVILTKEFLPKPIELPVYFSKIRESIEKRGIKDLKISDEKDLVVSGVRGKMMVCSWDVSAMADMLAKGKDGQAPKQMPNIKPGQRVKQIQVTLLKDQMAINITASFPEEQFEVYYKPFQGFLKSLAIA